MKKFLFASFIAILSLVSLSNTAQAQNYNYSLGVRAGYYPGIAFKYNFNARDGLELTANFKHSGFNLTGLYERHVPVIGEGFNFYYGAGANVGAWERDHHSKFTMGIDAIVGLEYKIPNAPIAFSVDYKPELNFIGHTGFAWEDVALSIRFAF